MADVPWWSTLLSTIVGGVFTTLTSWFVEHKKVNSERKRKQEEDVGKQAWHWRQQANRFLVLRADIESSTKADEPSDALELLRQFMVENAAML
jgi:hypothetical protein